MIHIFFGQVAEGRMVTTRSSILGVFEICGQPFSIIGRLSGTNVSEIWADSLYARDQRTVGEGDDAEIAVGDYWTNLLGVTRGAALCQVDVSAVHSCTRKLDCLDGIQRLRVFA